MQSERKGRTSSAKHVAVAVWALVSMAVAGCGDNELHECGNGERELDERCDDGNLVDGDGCDRDCTPTRCGNGVVTAGEACDDGNLVNGDGCDVNCTLPECGNGAVGPGEACDDGDLVNGDGCDVNCTFSGCGNGAVAPGEACDDGNEVDTDDCRNNCRAAVCGDGVAATGASGGSHEDCDGAPLDGTAPVETATCNLDCTARVCGDAKVNQTAGEQCDDGNTSDADACTNACISAVCGDGILRTAAPAEQCDDGNTATEVCAYNEPSCTVCDATCALAAGETSACGDGVAQAPFEVCDDGNAVDGDWCNTGCMAVALAPSTYVKASNTQEGDSFGWSIALSADGLTMAVGAIGEDSAATGVGGDQTSNHLGTESSGAVYVFTRSGATWIQQAYVKASNTGYDNWFGYSVALSADGSTLAVGAPAEDSAATGIGGNQADNSASSSGAVYVFTRAGTAWSQQAYIKASNTGPQDRFGTSVSLSADGSTLAVGAPDEDSAAVGIGGNQADNSASDSGAAYVFTRSGTTWSQQAYVKASNTGAGDSLSEVRLSADGSTLVASAPGEDSAATGINGDQTNNSATNSGAVYVFTRSGTTWSQQAYLKASNTDHHDLFGSISLSGDGSLLAVGAIGEDSATTGVNGNQTDDSATFAGAVYVFTRSGMTWSQQAYLKASNTDWGLRFGGVIRLSVDGSTLVASARYERSAATGINGDQSDQSLADAGAVYRFTRRGTRWSQQAYIKASNTRNFDQFGFGLALSGDGAVLAAGSPFESSATTGIGGDQSSVSAPNSGAVYVFY